MRPSTNFQGANHVVPVRVRLRRALCTLYSYMVRSQPALLPLLTDRYSLHVTNRKGYKKVVKPSYIQEVFRRLTRLISEGV